MRLLITALLLAAWLLPAVPAAAAEAALPPPAMHAVDRAVVERAVGSLLAGWNRPGFAAWLAADFPGREPLLAALAAAPVAAELRLLGLGGIQTLEQQRVDGAVVSLVSATARVVLRYPNASGWQRREATLELVLRLTRQPPRR